MLVSVPPNVCSELAVYGYCGNSCGEVSGLACDVASELWSEAARQRPFRIQYVNTSTRASNTCQCSVYARHRQAERSRKLLRRRRSRRRLTSDFCQLLTLCGLILTIVGPLSIVDTILIIRWTQPERIRERDWVATREPILIHPPRDADGIFLRKTPDGR